MGHLHGLSGRHLWPKLLEVDLLRRGLYVERWRPPKSFVELEPAERLSDSSPARLAEVRFVPLDERAHASEDLVRRRLETCERGG